MITETQIRSQILRRILRIPSNKLPELNEFVSRLEQSGEKKGRNLSFAGVWNDIEASTLAELTDHLIPNREKTKRRTHESGID